MLVCFTKGFTMEGENSYKERKHFWSKPQEVRHKIYCNTWVYGICDESEVESEIERKTQKQLKTSGWGIKFSGWQRVVPYEEIVEIYKSHGWHEQLSELPSDTVRLDYINTWKMDKILAVLTGDQFLQFCKGTGLDPMKVRGTN